MLSTVGNYLLGNMVNDYVQKMLTITLREETTKVLKEGPSRPSGCNVA